MSRILLIAQEKGGVGKTVFARALAEAVEGAPVIEIDASHRMRELGNRVQFFKMRADRETIEKTGGKASRAEFDAVLSAIEKGSFEERLAALEAALANPSRSSRGLFDENNSFNFVDQRRTLSSLRHTDLIGATCVR